MFVTIINDCNDPNDLFARQATRVATLFNSPVIPVKVENYSDLEASGNLVDALDASEGSEGVILVNVAPRHGLGKKWENGTPFGYFYYHKTLVVATVSGYTLSLPKKLGLIDKLYITHLPDVVDKLVKLGKMEQHKADQIKKTQFRSYEYSPKLAKYLWEGIDLPAEEYDVNEILDVDDRVWLTDSFGNCKTTILEKELDKSQGEVETKWGRFKIHERLKDLATDEAALYVGSSGIEDKRFVEFTINGQNAAQKYEVKIGDKVLV